jgi:DNA-binding transcriptional MerR regulator
MKALDIAEVAAHTGMPAATLRFYEEKGLIASRGRRGLRRLFGHDVLQRLALVSMGRAAGLSLDEMARMFGPNGELRVDRQVLVAKAEELERTSKQLQAMRRGLLHAAACPARSHLECPTFQRLLKAAERGAFSKQKTPELTLKVTKKPTRRRARTSGKRRRVD